MTTVAGYMVVGDGLELVESRTVATSGINAFVEALWAFNVDIITTETHLF